MVALRLSLFSGQIRDGKVIDTQSDCFSFYNPFLQNSPQYHTNAEDNVDTWRAGKPPCF